MTPFASPSPPTDITPVEVELLPDGEDPREQVLLLHVGGDSGYGALVHGTPVDRDVPGDAQLRCPTSRDGCCLCSRFVVFTVLTVAGFIV